jgi:peptidoglycan hydrolase-like amidase
MRRFLVTLTAHFFALAIAATLSVAQDFKPYPGSRLDEKASQQASAVDKGTEVQVYTTGDAFEKVRGFYTSLYREVAVPFPKPTLPNGKEVKWAFFVLDGGKDLMHSNYWMKVQRPYIGTVDDEADFQDVRDISVIQTVRRHASAFKKSHLLDISDRK